MILLILPPCSYRIQLNLFLVQNISVHVFIQERGRCNVLCDEEGQNLLNNLFFGHFSHFLMLKREEQSEAERNLEINLTTWEAADSTQISKFSNFKRTTLKKRQKSKK